MSNQILKFHKIEGGDALLSQKFVVNQLEILQFS